VYAFAASSAQPSSPPPVTAYTPCQSPVIPEASGSDPPDPVGPADPLRDDVESEVPREEISPLLPFIAPLHVRPDIYYISPPRADAPQLELLQQALVLNRGYFDYISETSNAWRARTSNRNVSLDFSESKELKDFTSGMWRGRDLLLEGQLPKTFKCFDHAFASIHGILKNHSRKFLPELYEMLINFQLDDQQDVLGPLLQYVAKMSRVNRRSQQKSHNISKIALCLLQMNRADRSCAVECLLQNVCHRFQPDLAYDQRKALTIRKVLSRSVFCRMQISEAIAYLTNILQDDQSVYCVDSYENCLILFKLAKCYRFQNRLDDAIS
jgi:tetratricopeptide (TPR) repeat protein